MSKPPSPSLLRLVLWPAVITTLVSVARLYFEVQGTISSGSGGAGVMFGVTILVPVFGVWFGYRIARAGSHPRMRPPALWFVAALTPVVATVAWAFMSLDPGDVTEAGFQALRAAVLTIVAVAVVAAVFGMVIWWRLAAALLLYGSLVRAGVCILTYVAKTQPTWDTHYTKFGQAGIQRDMAETMTSACVAQFGFWVPFTILVGGLFGSLAAWLSKRK